MRPLALTDVGRKMALCSHSIPTVHAVLKTKNGGVPLFLSCGVHHCPPGSLSKEMNFMHTCLVLNNKQYMHVAMSSAVWMLGTLARKKKSLALETNVCVCVFMCGGDKNVLKLIMFVASVRILTTLCTCDIYSPWLYHLHSHSHCHVSYCSMRFKMEAEGHIT